MTLVSLRERKKLGTRRALIDAARELVAAQGLKNVTVERIAETAGYTSRTFFNHFSSKEEAVVAHDPVRLALLAKELRARPAAEHPVDALRAVLIGGAEPEERIRSWQLRADLVARFPKLLPCYLASTDEVEQALTEALANRPGGDPFSEPILRMLVAAVVAAGCSGVAWWSASDREVPLASLLEAAFDLISRAQPHRKPPDLHPVSPSLKLSSSSQSVA